MAFIDLEDRHPDTPGIYTVKAKSETGEDRICKAEWVAGEGFLPVNTPLRPEEYYFEWEAEN